MPEEGCDGLLSATSRCVVCDGRDARLFAPLDEQFVEAPCGQDRAGGERVWTAMLPPWVPGVFIAVLSQLLVMSLCQPREELQLLLIRHLHVGR